MDLEAVQTKLTAARTRLILDKPFLGALVLRLPMAVADPKWCRTTATDARKLYYNPQYIDALDVEQVQFVLAHEALHCALSHFARREHRNKQRWDLACDYAINPILLKDGLKPPPGILYERSYEGMTAEEIYPYIEDNPLEETLDEHVYDKDDNDADGKGENSSENEGDDGERDQEQQQNDGGAGNSPEAEIDPNQGGASQPPPLTSTEAEELSVQWQQRLAGAAQQAMQAGKMGGELARLVDELLQPKLPWRMLLARYMTATARDDYSYTRPSTRRGEPAIYPSLRSAEINVLVALDTSGSVSDREIAEFISEINAIKSTMRARILLTACDSRMAPGSPWVFEPWEELKLPESFQGGGGTSFRPVIEWAEAQDRAPDLVVYFTDAKGEFPRHEPAFPVIWLVKGRAQVPWGTRIQLN
ncbi:MAG: hypothetical protein D6717_05165 [Gammaproteobacteria bacterium]|nr:MAG: hypothetical protein D6717_05165 [Gammaproteobacteria bacterium]